MCKYITCQDEKKQVNTTYKLSQNTRHQQQKVARLPPAGPTSKFS